MKQIPDTDSRAQRRAALFALEGEASSLPLDPVCGMPVDPTKAKASCTYEGRTFYFCCEGCKDTALASPNRYLVEKTEAKEPCETHTPKSSEAKEPCETSPSQKAEGSGACCSHAHTASLHKKTPKEHSSKGKPGQYTCPMHPEILSERPGDCPLCGMALEAIEITADAAEHPEIAVMRRRFVGSAILTVPLLFLAMGEMLPGVSFHRVLSPSLQGGLQAALATPVVLWGGAPFFQRGWASLLRLRFNMFTLIALGTGIAYLFSLVALAFPSLLPPSLFQHGKAPLYFESAAVIVTLVLLGQWLELRAREQTQEALRSLLALAPKTALRLRYKPGETEIEEEIPLADVQIGDRLRIKPGASIPVDGVILEGESEIDEAMLTGEAIPIFRRQGDPLFGGTLNTTGSFVLEARKIGQETRLAQIVSIVLEAQRSRAPIQELADTVATWFVPAVIGIALGTFGIWMAWGPEPRLTWALVNSIAVLIIACPCALGLATPMSIMAAAGRAASVGLLFKQADALEAMSRIDLLALDKTGTLTEGRPVLQGIVVFRESPRADAEQGPLQGGGEDEALEREGLRLAASLEKHSEHPIARALVEAAISKEVVLSEVTGFSAIAGQGVEGRVEGRSLRLGTLAFAGGSEGGRGTKGEIEEGWQKRAASFQQGGETVIFLSVEREVKGFFRVTDPIRAEAKAMIDALRRDGVEIAMLTGDAEETAQKIAGILGIREIHARLSPEGKKAQIERYQAQGRRVAMAGDGINDAPALAQAEVGIAMGGGTEVAIQSAPITLLKGDLRGLLRARHLSRATFRNVRQNLFFAFFYNALGIPLAAGVLYPIFGLLLSPMIASVAMSLSSVCVITNALRLRRLPLP